MFTQKLMHSSLAFAVTLSLAGVASARRPPALAEVQTRTEAVAATCPEGRSSGGYRDMFARTVSIAPMGSVAALPAPRKVGDHLVLVCEGGEVHQGSGYRDFPARLQPNPRTMQFAAAPRPTHVR